MFRSVVGGLIALLVTALPMSASADDLIGCGGVGFRGGMSRFYQDHTSQRDARARLSGDLVFTYVSSDHLWLDATVGYAWNRLDDNKDFWLATSVPVVAGVRYLTRNGQTMRPYLGVGGGMYVWSIQSRDLGASTDPITKERLRRAVLGFYGAVGVERTMSKHIVTTGDILYHYILAKDTADFPSGYNGNKSYAQVRLGVTFYFSLSERIDTGLPE